MKRPRRPNPIELLAKSPSAYAPVEEFAPVSAQLEFTNPFPAPKEGFSHTLELFDAIPKFVFSRSRRLEKVELVHRTFIHRGGVYNTTLHPASIDGKDGVFLCFPGEREELVLRALRYIAAQKQSQFGVYNHKNGQRQLQLKCTLSEIQNVLALKTTGIDGRARGHKFQLSEIDEALNICVGTVISLNGGDNEIRGFRKSTLLAHYSGIDKLKEGEKSHLRTIVFHPLANTAIIEGEYRAINYRRTMSLPSPLARWIYERLAHIFINAEKRGSRLADGIRKPAGYPLSLQVILAESGFQPRKKLCNTIDDIRSCLKELSFAQVLLPLPVDTERDPSPYSEEKKFGEATKGRRPVIDIVWTLYPSDGFVQEIIEANIQYRDAEQGG